jgi:hypothetical protein
MSSFIGLEQCKAIVQEHDRKTLYPMLLTCSHHLHPLFENVNVDQHVDENFSLDILEMPTNTNKLVKELVTIKLLILRGFKWMQKISNVIFNGGKNMIYVSYNWIPCLLDFKHC